MLIIFCKFAFQFFFMFTNIQRIYLFVIVTILLFSCSTKKNILYLQDTNDSQTYSVNYEQYIIDVDDILKIVVSADNPETAIPYNPKVMNNFNESKESLLYNGYQVNSEGFIVFPTLGKIMAKGKTISELREYIFNSIVNNNVLVNPNVDVKHLNSSFTILGDVSKPGRYEFLKNNLNILEAIGMAGDLNITGNRDNVKIIRETNNNKTVSSIDLTTTDFMTSDNFQIFPGDIIIVNPNTTKVKNAGIIGNSGTLLSLLSFILTSIIVINN